MSRKAFQGICAFGIVALLVAITVSPVFVSSMNAGMKAGEAKGGAEYRGVRLNMATNYFLVIRQPLIFLIWMDFTSVDYLKSINANAVSMLLAYVVSGNGDINPFPFSFSLAKYHIERFHDAGMAVALTPIFISKNFIFGLMPENILQKDNFWRNLENRTVEAAEFAEEQNVEIFFSSNELELVLGWERALNFSKKILPEVRNVFNGKVGWQGWLRGLVDMDMFKFNGTVKLSVPIERFNFTGYDMYGMTADVGQDIKNSAESFAGGFIKLGERISRQSNTSFLLPEIFGRTPETEQITHFYFEEARGKAVGYFPIYTVWKKSFFDDFVKEFYSEIRE